jgi:thiamine biosynthesis lipoprotein
MTAPRASHRARPVRPASVTFGAWSCTVRLVVEDGRVLDAATADLVRLLDRVDASVSRFRPDSELSVANRRAGRPSPISHLTLDLVSAALQAAAATDGAVDPTVGGALCAIGYDRDIAVIRPGVAAIASVPAPQRSWREVGLYREHGLLTVPAGATLDLGATAKAFTADHAAQLLQSRYDTPVLVELGGDLAVAGSPAGRWPIWVAESDGGRGQSVTIAYGGVATSTTTVRRWLRGGMPVHHIIDPLTGAPADGPWRTVSVYASTALAANTASTAAIVLGTRALPWLSARGIAARLIDHAGAVTTTGAWPTAAASIAKAA